MNLLEYKILLDDKFSDTLNKIDGKLSKFDKKNTKAGAGLTKSFSGFSTLVKGGIIGMAVAGITKLGTSVISLASDMEQTKTSFSVMLGGSMAKAETMVNKINDFANVTPFENGTLFEGAKLLLNFGMSGEKIMPTMKMLGDISGGNAQRFSQLSLAYSQARSAGKLMGQDLLQMINAGFNPLQEISRQTGESIGALKEKMSKGKIGIKELDQAFKGATEKGGKFYKMMEKQSKTFSGRTSTLMGKIKMIGINIGTAILPILGKGLDKLIQFADGIMQNFDYIKLAFEPVISAFKEMWSEIGNLLSKLIPTNIEGGKTGSIWVKIGKVLKFALIPTKIMYKTLTFLFKLIANGIDWIKKMYDRFAILRGIIDALLYPFKQLIKAFEWLGNAVDGDKTDKKLMLLQKLNIEYEKAKKLQEAGVKLTERQSKIIKNYARLKAKLTGTKFVESADLGSDANKLSNKLLNNGGLTNNNNKSQSTVNKITGSAPKVFNLRIEKFVEKMTIETTNIQEGAEKIKDIIIHELTKALMDVQTNIR